MRLKQIIKDLEDYIKTSSNDEPTEGDYLVALALDELRDALEWIVHKPVPFTLWTLSSTDEPESHHFDPNSPWEIFPPHDFVFRHIGLEARLYTEEEANETYVTLDSYIR